MPINLPKTDIDIYGPFIFYGPGDEDKMPKFELRGDEVIGDSPLIISSDKLKQISDSFKKEIGKQKQQTHYGGKKKSRKKKNKKSRKKSRTKTKQ